MKKIYLYIIMLIMLMSVKTIVVYAKDIPKVNFVGVEHSPLVEGDTETLYITSISSKLVQYRVFLYEEKNKKWSELTSGYSELVSARIPYEVKSSKIYEKGKYKVSVWVRENGSSNKYDSFYIAYLNCVSRDDTNRVYLSGELVIDKQEYKVGETVEIDGISDISGMEGPYQYKLHVFNATKGKWIKDITEYSEGKLNWQPTEDGVYVIDLWAISSNSTLWDKLNLNKIASAYEGWKLKVIHVRKSEIQFNEYDYTLDKLVDIQYALNIAVQDNNSMWAKASKNQIKQYANPLNYMYDDGKYQFLNLNFTEGITVEAINAMLKGKGVLEGKGQAFLEACKENNVSPIYLISHAFLETGKGTSILAKGVLVSKVDGKVVTPKKVYNLFGINAFDKDPNRYGSEYAYKRKWFTVDEAIRGGAKWISEAYINNAYYKQNTLYKMRWNPEKPGTHQYATDIAWAYKQTQYMTSILNEFRNGKYTFEIPKFNDISEASLSSSISGR